MIVRVRDIEIDFEEEREVHPVASSSIELASRLEIEQTDTVLDLGCGSGLFALLAAKLGAREVWATDVDVASVRVTERNAQRNHVILHTAQGDTFEPVRERRFNVIISNPPQTPAPVPFRMDKYGGPEGTLHTLRLAREASAHLVPGGRLYTMLIGLSHYVYVLDELSRLFAVTELGRTKRSFTAEEYDGYQPGLFAHLQCLREAGRSEFFDGYFWIRHYRCALR